MSVHYDGTNRAVEPHDAVSTGVDGPVRPYRQADLLFESSLAYAKPNPWRLLQVMWWAARGTGHLQAQLSQREFLELAKRAAGAQRADTRSTPIARSAAAAPAETNAPEGLLKSLRLHQWAKNLLVFVPLVLAGQLTQIDALTDTLIAFLALSIVASSTYIINDMWDASDDRRHWSKRDRPIASGQLPMATAAATVPLGLLIGFSFAAMVSESVLWLLLLYLVVTVAYTVSLKRIILIDGVVLAGLFTLRIAVGVVAADVPPSAWLVVFSMFLFASLSYAKRHTEIARVAQQSRVAQINGRGYHTSDAPIVLGMGLGTGIGAVLILVLYVAHDAFSQTFYTSAGFLWAFPLLVFLFVSRIWIACLRDELHDDPVAFALTDRACLCLLAIGLACFALAWLGPLRP